MGGQAIGSGPFVLGPFVLKKSISVEKAVKNIRLPKVPVLAFDTMAFSTAGFNLDGLVIKHLDHLPIFVDSVGIGVAMPGWINIVCPRTRTG